MAKEFRQTPSSILRIDDDYDAFKVDRSVWIFGSSLQSELNSIDEQDPQKRMRIAKSILEKWIPEANTPVEKKYRDPAGG